jgi:pimeloyl-ACP methyl ester carboxylesterase
MQSLIITQQNVSSYSFTNLQEIIEPIRGIVISLHGWYETNMRNELTSFEKELARKQILSIYPYYSEWCWMNFPTIHLIDELIDFYIGQNHLSQNIPIAVMGRSMGGYSALMYSLYGRRTPIACAVNCPICDLPYHVTEREDIPRTMYSAFGHYNIPLDIAIRLHSPLHQVEHMPRIPYYNVHGIADLAVPKKYHSDPYVKRMRELNYDIEYHEVENMEHCDFRHFPEEKRRFQNFVISKLLPHSSV